PTSTSSVPDPEPTEECEDDEELVTESVTSTRLPTSSKPTATPKAHNAHRRAMDAARGWGSRMERRFVGAPPS
ncbi:hypothetical protein FS749_007476, partial [Ceratobasidium sp. UAMH 11750]